MKRKTQLTLIWLAVLSFPSMMILCEILSNKEG